MVREQRAFESGDAAVASGAPAPTAFVRSRALVTVATQLSWRPALGARTLDVIVVTADEVRQRQLRPALSAVASAPSEQRLSASGLTRLRGGSLDVAIIDRPCHFTADVAVIHRLARFPGDVAVLVVGDTDVSTSVRAVRAGASAILPRDVDPADLREAVVALLQGQAVVPPAVAVEIARLTRASEQPD